MPPTKKLKLWAAPEEPDLNLSPQDVLNTPMVSDFINHDLVSICRGPGEALPPEQAYCGLCLKDIEDDQTVLRHNTCTGPRVGLVNAMHAVCAIQFFTDSADMNQETPVNHQCPIVGCGERILHKKKGDWHTDSEKLRLYPCETITNVDTVLMMIAFDLLRHRNAETVSWGPQYFYLAIFDVASHLSFWIRQVVYHPEQLNACKREIGDHIKSFIAQFRHGYIHFPRNFEQRTVAGQMDYILKRTPTPQHIQRIVDDVLEGFCIIAERTTIYNGQPAPLGQDDDIRANQHKRNQLAVHQMLLSCFNAAGNLYWSKYDSQKDSIPGRANPLLKCAKLLLTQMEATSKPEYQALHDVCDIFQALPTRVALRQKGHTIPLATPTSRIPKFRPFQQLNM